MEQVLMEKPGEMTVEVRAFSFLKQIFDERGWPSPLYLTLDRETGVGELADKLSLPHDKIEAVFINGLVHKLTEGRVKPGDRVAFLPPGTPGPYRVFLGIKELPEQAREENDG